MSRLGFKSVVYHGDTFLGELDTVPVSGKTFQFPNNEIRIHHLSPQSERCPPLSILQAISPFSIRCKLESSSPAEQTNLIILHASLFHDYKTAVVPIGEEEIHLVAMPSKQKKFPCFWCYSVPMGLYHSCLGMLNTRCLSIVFDLDETLIVANTLKSFEDKIEALKGWIARESDPIRIAGMSAEMKRYAEDRVLLKQYADNDCVVDNGKVLKVQMEEVSPLSDGLDRVVRPVIRLPEKNAVLTRINPEIRDTSVLVRLRPAWEDLRSYLTAKGRKRFEVYVCTMAERDYALEMWRLLDPESHLIGLKQLRDRVVCVKSASRKSLLNVFRDGICHPKMAMVIDDRLKVWEDKDQPRVHVVPPFLPYYAPQAETANAVPILCVARNVACNVRGCFFKEFDENLLRRISEVFYEDEVAHLPPAPDVSSYLMTEDVGFAPNGNTNAPIGEGMNGADVDGRLNQLDGRPVSELSSTYVSFVLKSESSQPLVSLVPNVSCPPSATAVLPSQKPSLLGASGRKDNSSGDSDSETKRRVPGFKSFSELKSQSSGQSSIPTRVPAKNVSMSMQPQGGWLDEEDDKKVQIPNSSSASSSASLTPRGTQVKTEEMHFGLDTQKQNLSPACQVSDVGRSQNHVSSNSREFQAEGGKLNALPSHLCIGVLQEIARRCGSKVEFRPVTSTSKDLLFSVEVLFSGEKIGVGMGKTRKDAQQQAAEHALNSLAEKYMAYATPRSGVVDKDLNKASLENDNGFLWDLEDAEPGSNGALREDVLPKEEPIKTEAGSTSSSSTNQQTEKIVNPPRLLQYTSNKRMKQEPVNGTQGLLPSKLQKTSHSTVS